MSSRSVRDDLIRIHRITAPTSVYMDHVNVILAGEGPFVLFDSGYAETTADLLAWLREAAPGGPEKLILTHFHRDHLGGAEAVCKATGARAYGHPLEIPMMKEREPALEVTPLKEGECVRVGEVELEAVLTPGHSPGHLSFWWAAERVLIGGDNVLLPTTTSISPPFGRLSEYVRTLQRIRELAPVVIYPGHGSPVRNPEARIQALLTHRVQRETQVLAALAKGPTTAEGIAGDIYRDLGETKLRMGTNMTRSHLEKLVEEGRVLNEEGTYRLMDR